jgi:hypothetical protein
MNIRNRFDFFLSALPVLEDLGSVPPISKRVFRDWVMHNGGPQLSVDTLLLSDDLMVRQAALAGEINFDQAEFCILAETEGEPVLPEQLTPTAGGSADDSPLVVVDELWSRYFYHAAEVAQQYGSKCLAEWVGFEVDFRNTVVVARAQALDLDPNAYLVAPDLGASSLDAASLITAWSAAADPLSGLEVLDRARWDWIIERDSWYSFAAAEIQAYTAKLTLLHRWRRLSQDVEMLQALEDDDQSMAPVVAQGHVD